MKLLPKKKPAPTRIVMLLGNCTYPRDGRVRREATALVSAGLSVTVICPRGAGQLRREVIGGVAVRRYWLPLEGSGVSGFIVEHLWVALAALASAVGLLMLDGFDVVHVHNPPDTLGLVALPFKLAGKTMVYDHHDLAPDLYEARDPEHVNRFIRQGLAWLERVCCRSADQVITTNESYRRVEHLRDRVPHDRITIVRNGPEPELFRVVAAAMPHRIGFAGTLGPQDGGDHLVRAIASLVHDHGHADLSAIVMGDGSAVPALQDLARELRVQDHVVFTGQVPNSEVVEALSRCQVCVEPAPSSPYNDRSTVIKLMEYMALGKPVVAYDLPEHRVSAGDTAVFAAPNDPDALAKEIDALFQDPARGARIGAAARERALGPLAWQTAIPNLLHVYRMLGADVCQV